MEALYGGCSNSLSLLFQNHKNPAFLSQPASASLSFYAPVKSKSLVSLKTYDFHDSTHLVVSKKSSKCSSSVARPETTSDDPKDGTRKKNLAVFLSGGGSNFRALHEATVNGAVHGDFVLLVTDKQDSGGAKYARDKGIPVTIYPSPKRESGGLTPNDLVSTLSKYKVDFILLAGYLKLIPSEVIRAYPNCILNIHPSLLPSFGGKGYYGLKVHKAVIASGARYSGPTIHFVDEKYDTGRILAQRIVPVLADDTAEQLAARVLRQEHKMYVEVAAAVCEERITWREDGVPLIRSKANPNHYS